MFIRLAGAVALFALVAAPLAAQPAAGYAAPPAQTFSGSVAQPLSAPNTASAEAIVSRFLSDRGINVPAASLVASSSPAAAANGVTVVRLEQTIGGLRAYGVYAKVALTSGGAIVQLIENLVPGTPSLGNGSSVNDVAALNAALRHLYPQQNIAVGAARRNGNTTLFDRTPFFHDTPSATRVAVVADDGSVSVGHVVETWSEQGNRLHETLIGAGGNVLAVQERTSRDSYKIFVEDPTSTPTQTVVAGPGSGNTQSPIGWLFSGAQNSVNIGGNNVRAYLDANANNKPDTGGIAVNTGDFLSDANFSVAPSTSTNREVAVQNLFYLNNVLHDTLLQHGFTEAVGNFQETNFTATGRAADSVLAEAQDGSGTNNANFATPSDGRKPRMQMYLWTGAGSTHEVVVNSPVTAAYNAATAEFGPAVTTGPTGDVVLANDGTGTSPTDGCEAFSGVSGKIALIDRGNCDFTVKVFNAQSAGAIAAIIANNQGGTALVAMGGTNRRIRIPALSISQNDGASLKGLAAPNVTMRQKPVAPLQIDASLDSDVVYHEYGHGLTWRMIDNMSGPLAGAIGEGASDSLAMMINGDDRIGEYSATSPTGIRRAPYTNYPNTYGDVTGDEVHGDGEIYAAAMWRTIELFGADRSRLFDIWVDGMNFTPSAPTYEQMRDGMLQSIANAGGANEATDTCNVWKAFAQYGIGVGATGVVKGGGTVTITESFTVPASCTP